MGKDFIMNKKSFAFTLSEVLITMTIVGVVAALTIPTLNYQRIKREYSTKIKNFYSKMENAVLDMEQDYGSIRDLKKPADAASGFEFYMKYLDPYIGHQYVKSDKRTVYFSDGSSFTVEGIGSCLDAIYDVNGDNGPGNLAGTPRKRTEGRDQFRFLFCFTDDQRIYWFGNRHIFFGSYGGAETAASTTRDAMVSKCESNPMWCTRLLQNDNWEFKSDYPFKF